ncbi:uncharacterized protein LOC113228556 [Hyposmocoma kahamanoa]|uniref:uncharacterized protein LOC113228556 n=1 Tax=Hyposmocoma kahamanoa TaxID=1477025 RepID=UPI000E6D8573|nr:uncharacterized protein LOC113228556 [Hyposmocoma kahamanoa]
MTDPKLISKLADIPLAKPGFDALDISKPVLMQMNPEGKWERSVPKNIEEEMLKSVVQQLISTQAVSAAKSYCTQCASDAQRLGGKSNYVPIIMMPINGISSCPFDDIECEDQLKKEKALKYTQKKSSTEKQEGDEKLDKKPKKRPFVLQRLTDFDLISQW